MCKFRLPAFTPLISSVRMRSGDASKSLCPITENKISSFSTSNQEKQNYINSKRNIKR